MFYESLLFGISQTQLNYYKLKKNVKVFKVWNYKKGNKKYLPSSKDYNYVGGYEKHSKNIFGYVFILNFTLLCRHLKDNQLLFFQLVKHNL